MITKEELRVRIQNACAAVIAAEEELTEIDSRFGDADHGFTMAKIAKTISESVEEGDSIQEMLDNAGCAVMVLNGGSAVPLWNTWLDGMQEGAPEAEEIDAAGIKAIWNFAPTHLDVPENILVQNENMATSLAVLSMHLQAHIKEKK